MQGFSVHVNVTFPFLSLLTLPIVSTTLPPRSLYIHATATIWTPLPPDVKACPFTKSEDTQHLSTLGTFALPKYDTLHNRALSLHAF